MCIVLKALEELDELLMHQGVVRQLEVELLALALGGELPMQ